VQLSRMKNKLLVISCLALGFTVFSELSAANELDNRMLGSLLQITARLERAGKLEEAIKILFPHRQDPRILQRLHGLYYKSGKSQEFLPLVEEIYSGEPENEMLIVIYLRALATAELVDSLRKVGLRLVEQSPKEERRYRLVAQQFRSSGLPEQALMLYRQGRKALNKPLAFQRGVANVLIDLGHFDQALDEMLAYLASNPNQLPIVRRQAYRILEQGEEGSLLLVNRLEKELLSSSNRMRDALLRMIIDVNLTLETYDRAYAGLEELLETLEARQAGVQIKSFIAKCLKLENYAVVLAAYDLADSLDLINKGNILLEKADILLKMGEVSKAESELLELASGGQEKDLRALAMKKLGEMYLTRLNNPAQALQWYRGLEQIGGAADMNLVQVKLKIAESFIRLGQLHEARNLCNILLETNRGNSDNLASILLTKADIHFYQGEPDSASKAYLAFAKFLLGAPEANDAIERVYLIQNDKSPEAGISSKVGRAYHEALCGRIQSATELFQETLRAVADSVYRAQVYYQMGRMYETAGEFPLALGVYEEIVRSLPGHHLAPMARLRMSLVLLNNIGDAESARRHLESIVFDYPEGVVTPVARRLLRTLEKNAL